MRTKTQFLFIASFVLFSVSCNNKSEEIDNVQNPFKPIVDEMSLQEKVCQMFIVRPEALDCSIDAPGSEVNRLSSDMSDFYKKYPAGGFYLCAGNIVSPEQLLNFTSDLHSLSPKPLLCISEEGGQVAPIANNDLFGLEKFESMSDLASDNDERKVYNASSYIGSYLKKYGFDVDFAPVADINSNPDNIVIGPRAFSDNPQIAAKMVVNYISGLWNSKIVACVKHFPGYGDTETDISGCVINYKPWEMMKNCEVIPFKAGIDIGAKMIMTAHVAPFDVTKTYIPSTFSSVMLKDKLCNELGYSGIIITEALDKEIITRNYDSAQAAIEAVKAGVDIVLSPADYVEAVDGLVNAVEEGLIDEEVIDSCVIKILRLKFLVGLL